MSLDLSDPSAPRLVQELKLGENYRPHWMAADRSGHRIVVTGRGDMEHRVLLVRFDPVLKEFSTSTASKTNSHDLALVGCPLVAPRSSFSWGTGLWLARVTHCCTLPDYELKVSKK